MAANCSMIMSHYLKRVDMGVLKPVKKNVTKLPWKRPEKHLVWWRVVKKNQSFH